MAGERPSAVIAAFFANLGIAVAKLVAFVFTGSSSMLAEGIHSIADTGNQALLLLGHKRGSKAPDQLHPFGYGQERYFWALLVAVILFTVGALFSLWEGWSRLSDPHHIESLGWAIGVLLLAMVFESLALMQAIRAANLEREGSWWHYIRTTKSPENAVVLLEDLAAEIGLVIAFVGVVLAQLLDEPRFDAFGSLGIGVVLALVAVVLAVEMRSLLVGESAQLDEVAEIEEALAGHRHVRRLVELKTMHLGPDRILVAARLELADHLDIEEVVATLDEVESGIKARLALTCDVYLVPD